MSDIIYRSAKYIAESIREKRVSAVEVVEAHLAQIEELNPHINAVVALCAERALDEAKAADAAIARGDELGALHGVPMTLKDSLDTEGVVTTGGTMGRKDYVPERDSTVAARLRAAGAILLGKTNTPELTLAGETDNLVYGRTNNPWDMRRAPGGSSGGAAAIVSVGGSAFDIGSDTGGSIRGPAHCCGITGIKPTSGRVPRTGHVIPYGMGATDAFTQNGPMARRVEDLALILPIISGPDWEDPAIVPMPLGDPADVSIEGLRVAIYGVDEGQIPEPYTPPSEDTMSVMESVVAALESLGAAVSPAAPTEQLRRVPELQAKVSGGDGRAWVWRLLDKAGTRTEDVSPFLKKRFEEAETISTEEFALALEELDRYRSEMLGFMHDYEYDAIICPVSSGPAPMHGQTFEPQNRNASYTGPYNLTGWPSTVVPVAFSQRMPLGIQIVARPWREDVSLALAQSLDPDSAGWTFPSNASMDSDWRGIPAPKAGPLWYFND